MSKTLSRLALAAVAVLLLGSCAQINERIDKLESRINGIENETIKSIDGQVNAINQSIADLGSIRSSIQSLTQTVGSQDGDIESLQKADKALGERIDSLSAYVNGELVNYAKTEWVNATFSTLAQYEETCDTIAKIDARIGALDTRLSGEIAAVVDSLKSWINVQFGSYYTAAQMDAKLEVLQVAIDSAKAENKAQADSIAAELAAAKAAVDSAKANIRAEYRMAVDTAITALDGKLSKALQDSIAAVNGRIDHLEGWVKAIDDAVVALRGRVEKLEQMIQSVVIIPAYSDGSVEVKGGLLYLDIIVEPVSALTGLTKDSLTVLVNTVKTKAVNVDEVAVSDLKVENGIIKARTNIASKLPEASGNALTVAVNVQNGLADYTTNFYPVIKTSESNVSVTAATAGSDSTKITIAADSDFPESGMGNITVADGFKESIPTSITVKGIGTVTFNDKATTAIKSNAENAGATSIMFKVEDVTTTKPVPNADVVLEVTMKTVDEQGEEVFSETNAGEGSVVTIQIPLGEGVAYVNSVALVNADGDPIEGGVVPGSEKIENGILTFQVNHFSKYAVDYVRAEDYKAVTGVSLNKTSVNLPVGDSIELTATINPSDATDKRVNWISSNPNVATVDSNGKVKAIAFGTDTITVTTKDRKMTDTCYVRVTETKTMAEILATNTGIPESDDLTPPAMAWLNSSGCKAFVGIKVEGDTVFVIKGGSPSLEMFMDDPFEKKNSNTYELVKSGVGTFTITMTDGTFTSIKFEAASDSGYECLNGTYSAPVLVSVTFVNPEGDINSTMPDTQHILKGNKITKPKDPTDQTTGSLGFHTLAGWYKTKNSTTGELSDPWNFDTDVVTGDITLYAQWQTTIEKILGKAAKTFPHFDSAPTVGTGNFEGSWVRTDLQKYVFYGFKNGNKNTIAVRNTDINRLNDPYPTLDYYDNCLKTKDVYTFDGKNSKYMFYIEGGVFNKMVYQSKAINYNSLNGTYTPKN